MMHTHHHLECIVCESKRGACMPEQLHPPRYTCLSMFVCVCALSACSCLMKLV
jgi:hypothetical protein